MQVRGGFDSPLAVKGFTRMNVAPRAGRRTAPGAISGGGGIRTLEGPGRPLAVFKTAAFVHSATPPVAIVRLAAGGRGARRRGRRRSRLLGRLRTWHERIAYGRVRALQHTHAEHEDERAADE